jgi:outer membrane lipoprotein
VGNMRTCHDYPEKEITTGLLVALTLLFCAGGCAPPFSQATLDQVDYSITFTELRSDPYRYKGKWVMIAGVIVSARNTQEGTFIEVLQRPTGRRGQPLDTDATEGRFIISSAKFLDDAVYHGGRLITVIGEVAGLRVQQLGETEYRYPVVEARELQLWEPSSGPYFIFGVSVFHGR